MDTQTTVNSERQQLSIKSSCHNYIAMFKSDLTLAVVVSRTGKSGDEKESVELHLHCLTLSMAIAICHFDGD